MKTKQFNVSQSRIYPDIRDKYLDYMREQYNMFISDDTLKNDLREILRKGTNKTIHFNILEKNSDLLVFETSEYSKLLEFTNHYLWIFRLVNDKWNLDTEYKFERQTNHLPFLAFTHILSLVFQNLHI